MTKRKALIKDLIMLAIAVVLAGIGLVINQVAMLFMLPWIMSLQFWKVELVQVLGVIPFSMMFMGKFESRKDSLTAFCIIGIFYAYYGKLGLLIASFITVFVCGYLRGLRKYMFGLESLVTGIFVSAETFLMMKIENTILAGVASTLQVVLFSFVFATLFSLLCELLIKKGIVETEAFDDEISIRQSYRKHSINLKLMLMLNLFFVVIIFIFSCFTYRLIKAQENTGTNRRNFAAQAILAHDLLPYEEAIKTCDEKALAELGKILEEKLVGTDLNTPGNIVLAARPDEYSEYVQVGYYLIESAGQYGVYSLEFVKKELEIPNMFFYTLVPGADDIALLLATTPQMPGLDRNLMKQIIAAFIVMLVAINLLGQYIIYRTVVKPVNELTSVAIDFAYDNKEAVEASKKKLEELEIHSGDEVESLYTTLSTTLNSMADYIDNVKENSEKISSMQHNVIVTMADIIESRDENTGGHIKRTAVYVRLIADKLKEKNLFPDILTDDYIENMSVAAPLHDMGKIHVPDAILNKNGRLTDEEFAIMKSHAGAGRELLKQASEQMGTFEYLDIALKMAGSHHEWWNGKGYPQNLVGEEIPLCARIMAVADVFDALVSKRCYKDGMPLSKAIGIIQEETGTHFDPVVAGAFLECMDEVEKILNEA